MSQDIEFAKTRAANLRRFLASKGVQLTVSESLEALSAQEGSADWNTYRASLHATQQEHELFCPFCGHRGKVRSIGSAFVEQGPPCKDGYFFEGDATQFECGACSRQFVDWEGGGELYARRDELVLIVTSAGHVVSARALSLMTLAETMRLFELASVDDYLQGCSAEMLQTDLTENTFGELPAVFSVTGDTVEAVLKLSRERATTPVFKVLVSESLGQSAVS
ncbi:glyoxalase superfamily protein [Burkholderia cenocepacia]|uniref:glyoxalase superfamily protein n=1 Tax=Burkholderia cenocepacia TaxID=95486 RepID=UPI000761AB17|nr:glyoxalase superfamily protein [Burkholderia cenocepacia]KWU23404.1 hypothetical protein AS149_37075 [Burkholderia cenocepacia]